MSQPIFVDTSAFYALIDRDERHHDAATQFLKANSSPLVTSEYVFDEAVTLVRYDFGYTTALTLGERLRASALCTVLPLDPGDLDTAWETFRRYKDQDFSFTDCTSFALMARLSIREAFTFDHHFWTAGFTVRP